MNSKDGALFAEPFCGGASVSISLLEEGIVDSVALNDVDPLIAALWATVFDAEEAEWLADQVLSVPLSIEGWHRQKSMSPANQREAALKCLYLNRTSFNGIIHKSGPIGGWGQEKRTLGARFNRERLAQRILALASYEDRVTTSNEDWESFCNRISRRRNALIYLDPPYYYKAEQLYGHVFDIHEHTKLRDYLMALESPWLLSYDNAEEVRKLYSRRGLQARVVDNTYSAHPLGGASFIGRELLYSNMNRLPPPDASGHHVGITVRHHAHANAMPGLVRFPFSADACERCAT
jgi:DNA adenine methylase